MLSLVHILTRQSSAEDFTNEQWDRLVRQARKSLLLPHLANFVKNEQLFERCHQNIQRQLTSALTLTKAHQRAVAWELNRIQFALEGTSTPVILLKGAAYFAQALPHAQHRMYGDIDLLVPREKIELIEEQLKWHGWLATHTNTYDQKYYRQWMHEIPPLKHAKRRSVLDIHHRILPPTAKITIDGQPLIDASVPCSEFPYFSVLDPKDQIIHSASHLFSEGETHHGVRDLLDLYHLVKHFSQDNADFIEQLIERANQLGLSKFLSYALNAIRTYCWPALSPAFEKKCADQPSNLGGALTRWTYSRMLQPIHRSSLLTGHSLAENMLFLRGHYLRMPLRLLIPHLVRKSFTRDKP